MCERQRMPMAATTRLRDVRRTPPPRWAALATDTTWLVDGRREHVAQHRAGGHAWTNETGEGGIVPRAATDHDRDLTGLGTYGSDDASGDSSDPLPMGSHKPVDRLVGEVPRIVEQPRHCVRPPGGHRAQGRIHLLQAKPWIGSPPIVVNSGQPVNRLTNFGQPVSRLPC
jgi:hypothetical protein